MATQATVTVTCDMCGATKDTRTRAITLDGTALKIDLCGKDSQRSGKVAQKLIPSARTVSGP